MTLTGTNINVNAGTNRLWIDGSGQMELPLDRDLKGEPLAKPGAIQVSWQQRMILTARRPCLKRPSPQTLQ